MGIKSFFKGLFKNNKNYARNEGTPYSSGYGEYIKNVDMSLKYKSGTNLNVKFLPVKSIALENGELKAIQEVELNYVENDGSFSRKVVAIDPIVMQDQYGNYVYDSKEYYNQLLNINKGLVKGFFEKSQVTQIENGYIGHITQDQYGNYNRSFENNIRNYYDKELEVKKEIRKRERQNSLSEYLKEQTNKIEEINVNYKDSHAEVLTPEMLNKDHYGR
jgi:hypothetical protein